MFDQPSFRQDFKRRFLRGLATLLPSVLTIVILIWVANLLYTYVGAPVNAGLRKAWAAAMADDKGTPEYEQVRQFVREQTNAEPPEDPTALYELYVEYRYNRYYQLSLLAIGLAVVGIYILGYFLATYVGRALWRTVEGSITALPFVRKVYPYAKQFTEFMFSDKPQTFTARRVVMVQYPRLGMWSVGFVTGAGFKDLEAHTGRRMVSVYFPSSPAPFTGYTVVVPQEDCVPVDVSVDAVMRFVISCGVIVPLNQLPAEEPRWVEERPAPLPPGDRPALPGKA